MKKVIFGAMALVFIGLVMNSCNKEDLAIKGIKNFDYVGEEHNLRIKPLMESLVKMNKKSAYKTLEKDSKTKSGSETNVERELLNCVPCNAINDPEVYLNELYSQLNMKVIVYNELSNILGRLDKDFNSLSELENWIENRKPYINRNFSGKEKEQVVAFYSTLLHSANFWAPKNENGQGGYDQFVAENGKAWGWKNWLKVAACDAVGAVGGAILGNWPGAVVGGVVASACSAINQA